MTVFLHEVHRVRGAWEDDFENAFREGWMSTLAGTDDARLLWYLDQAHGSGPSYRVVTITAFRDAAAWERTARRVHGGDLRQWARDVDLLRHDAVGKLLTQVPWSPMGDVDLASVPADPAATHEPTLYMEDTGWPHVPVDDYTAFWERVYLPMLQAAPRGRPRLLHVEAVFQPLLGAGRRPEAILMQRVGDPDGLLKLLTHGTPKEHRGPGTFMHDALQVRDQWESRLLRTSAWSPLH